MYEQLGFLIEYFFLLKEHTLFSILRYNTFIIISPNILHATINNTFIIRNDDSS